MLRTFSWYLNLSGFQVSPLKYSIQVCTVSGADSEVSRMCFKDSSKSTSPQGSALLTMTFLFNKLFRLIPAFSNSTLPLRANSIRMQPSNIDEGQSNSREFTVISKIVHRAVNANYLVNRLICSHSKTMCSLLCLSSLTKGLLPLKSIWFLLSLRHRPLDHLVFCSHPHRQILLRRQVWEPADAVSILHSFLFFTEWKPRERKTRKI